MPSRARPGLQVPPAKTDSSPTPERLLQLAWGYAPPLIIETALNYRLFDLLAEAPQSVEALAARTGASRRGLEAVLNALVGLALLTQRKGRYVLTPESQAFLVSSRPFYYGTYFMHITRQFLPRWMRLADAVRTGGPVLAVNQENQGPTFFAQFVESLFPINYQAARRLGEHLQLTQLASPFRVLDIGAGSGVWGIALAHLSPQIRVLAVDWPMVLEVTRKMARRHGVAERLETSAGDLLEADFGSGHNLAMMGHILHSEGPERSRQLLCKAFDAIVPGGNLAIGEFMPNEQRTGPPNALLFAVNMLIHTEHGNAFTFKEISGWLKSAGFHRIRLLEAPAPSPLILATRR